MSFTVLWGGNVGGWPEEVFSKRGSVKAGRIHVLGTFNVVPAH